MPSYLTAVLRNDSFRSLDRTRHPQARRRGAPWPVNEIVLQSLVLGGKNSAQIADQFGVSVDQVSGLRQAYGL